MSAARDARAVARPAPHAPRTGRDVRIPGAILLLTGAAFLLRLANVLAGRANPFFHFLRADSGAYDRWGQRIAAGEWIGHGAFYQDPLYPYLLGILYACFGRHLTALLLVQSLLGSLNVILLWALAARLWGGRTGLLAAVLAAFYAPFCFYDGLVLKTFLEVLLLNSSLLALILSARTESGRGARRRGLLSGVLLGLGTLARANYLLLVPLLLWWLLQLDPGPDRTPGPGGPKDREGPAPAGNCTALRRAAALGLLAGLALILLPVLVRNRVAGGDWALTTSQAGQNFYIGNNPENSRGTYVQPSFVRPDPEHEQEDFLREAERRLGRSLSPSQASGFWLRQGLAYSAAHPGRILALDLKKLGLLLHRHEIPDNEDLAFWGRYSPWLRFNPLRFGLIGPLGLVGLILGWHLRRRLSLLYLVLGGYLLSVTFFFVLGRYRLPAASILILFAAGALSETFAAWRRGDRCMLFLAGAALIPALLIVHHPEAEERGVMTPELYTNLGAAYLEAGRIPEALEAQKEAVRLAPEWADARYNLGVTLETSGDHEEAAAQLRRALRLQPGYDEAWFHLGLLDKAKGDLAGAADTLGRALELRPDNPLYLFTQARVLAESGRAEESEALLRRLEALNDPQYSAEGLIVRAQLRARQGDRAGAVALLREYLRKKPASALRPQVEALLQHWGEN